MQQAVWNKSLNCVQVLLNSGADGCALSDSNRRTPLTTAVWLKKWDFVDAISSALLDINNFKGNNGMPILFYPISKIYPENEILSTVENLLQRGADPNIPWREEQGITPLIATIEAYSKVYWPYRTPRATLRAFLRYGASVDAANYNGWTALMVAIENEDVPTAHLLLSEARADAIRPTNDFGETAFTMAVSAGHVDLTYLILRDNLDYFIPGMIHAIKVVSDQQARQD